MSYKDYLRIKASGIPNVVRVKGGDDASLLTLKKRYIASGTLRTMGTMLKTLSLPNQNSVPAISYLKKGGGPVPDASVFTFFKGSVGIDNDSAYLNNYQKVTPCNPIPQSSNGYNPASGHTRDIKICPQLLGESEGKPLFVDNMISYNPLANCLPQERVPDHRLSGKTIIQLYQPYSPATRKYWYPESQYNGIGNGVRMGGGVIRQYPGPINWKHGNPNVGHQILYPGYNPVYGNYINVRTRAFYNIQ